MSGTVTAAARRFRAAHHGQRPLVLPNVWDCASARVFTEAGFAALATSSSAVAATLGYADGQQTPVAEMFAAISRIARCVDVPVTADVEAGYGLAPAELAERLAEAGAVGCNLEDSDPAARELGDPGRQADFLAAVREAAGEALVINARVDVFVRPQPAGASADRASTDPASTDPAGADRTGADRTGADRAGADRAVADAAERGRRYLEAGADCCYPILAPLSALPTLVAEIGGPVNAMCRPGGPSLAELAATGVARITFGGSLHHTATEALAATARTLHAEL